MKGTGPPTQLVEKTQIAPGKQPSPEENLLIKKWLRKISSQNGSKRLSDELLCCHYFHGRKCSVVRQVSAHTWLWQCDAVPPKYSQHLQNKEIEIKK